MITQDKIIHHANITITGSGQGARRQLIMKTQEMVLLTKLEF